MSGSRLRLRGAVVALALIGAAGGAAAAEATIFLAGIAIRVDTDRWQIVSDLTPTDPAPSPDVKGVSVRCIVRPDCDEHAGVWVSRIRVAADGSGGATDPRDDANWGYDSVSLWGENEPPLRNFGGLAVGATVSFSGCRAWTPPFLHASGDHAGFRYTFMSGGGFGCTHIQSVPRNMFVELLSGISLIEGDGPAQ